MSHLFELPTWMYRQLKHRYAIVALAFLSFAESSVLPVPTIFLFIPLCMAKPARAWYLASVATLASILGSVYGYALGYLGYHWIDTRYGDWISGNWLAAVLHGFDQWGVVLVVVAGLLPLPFRYVAIGAGVTGIGIIPFLITATVSRGIHFAVVALLITRLSRKNSTPVTTKQQE